MKEEAPMITHYSFGRMEINGDSYNEDLIIKEKQVFPHWWRKRGHNIELSDFDLKRQLSPDLETVVIGTGYHGLVKLESDFKEYLGKNNIKLEAYPTSEAVNVYNKYLGEGKKVLGAFHLTC